MHQPIRRWFRIALWVVPFLALGAGVCALPIWPASGVADGFERLCSAAAAFVHVSQSAAAPAAAPLLVPAAAPAGPPPASAPAAIETVPGMPPVLEPGQSLQRGRGQYAEPGRSRRADARLCAQSAVQRRLRDRSGNPQGGRSFSGGVPAAARRPVLGPADLVGRQQRPPPLRRQPDADRPEDRQARATHSAWPTRTTCISRPTASRRSSSPSG